MRMLSAEMGQQFTEQNLAMEYVMKIMRLTKMKTVTSPIVTTPTNVTTVIVTYVVTFAPLTPAAAITPH